MLTAQGAGVSCRNAEERELLAIKAALKMANDWRWSYVIIESNSSRLVKAFMAGCQAPLWILETLFSQVLLEATELGVLFVWSHRETNRAVDALAKWAYKNNLAVFPNHGELPSDVVAILTSDNL